jgi:fused signal recognition particle receptor
MAFWRRNKDKPTEPQQADAPVTVPVTAAPPAAAGRLLDIDAAPVPGPDPAPEEDEAGWLARLTRGLSKSTSKFTEGLSDLVTKRRLDQEMLDQLEDLLITADLGPKTAAAVVADFSKDRFGKDLTDDEVREALAGSVAHILEGVAQPLPFAKPANGPMVILVCGVNGVGKTTTIGKIAFNLSRRQHRKVMMAAGDTFRAAAGEQLEIWAGRAQCKLLRKETGADAAAVAFEAYEQAKADNADVLLIDTAGRLHNKQNLMQELQKIVRVLKKHDESLPHAVLLVLDATTGQNALEQVRIFKDMVNVTGLAVTKLDGSARGGIVVALADQYKLPIHLIGVGEKEEDLRPFNPVDYARSLVGLP